MVVVVAVVVVLTTGGGEGACRRCGAWQQGQWVALAAPGGRRAAGHSRSCHPYNHPYTRHPHLYAQRPHPYIRYSHP